MNSRNAKTAAFTLAELMIVIVIIGILAALLLPAVVRSRQSAVLVETRQRMSTLSLALDGFYNDFGYYPPTDVASDGTSFGDYGYSEALVHYLANRFTRGQGDSDLRGNIPRLIGNAPVNAGPYLEINPKDLIDRDNDGWREYADPWGNAIIYIPRNDYFHADGTYRAGALVRNSDGSAPDPTASPLNEHFNRFKYQLISLGPDGWTAGLSPVFRDAGAGRNYRYFDVTIDKPNPINPNPALIGTDTDMTSPVIDAALGHVDGTADDINNWQ